MKWKLAAILAGFAAFNAVAISVAVVSTQTQYHRASLVVLGTAAQASPTQATLTVSEVIKGDAGIATVTFGTGGGGVDGTGPEPAFTVRDGSEYYVFLWFDEKAQAWRPVSDGQGVYRVYQVGKVRYVENAYEWGIRVVNYGIFVSREVLPGRVRESELRKAMEDFAADAGKK